MSICLLSIPPDLRAADENSTVNFQGPGLSNTHQTQHSPIEKLAVELLMHIFCQCERGLEPALTVSHVCQYWRAVGLQTRSLWTKVDVYIHQNSSTERFDAFISLLGMQLDRTGQLPLEVFWQREGSDRRNVVIEDLIRRKGHFSRWRSLRARFEYDPQDAEPILRRTDVFNSLEYLEILSPSCGHPTDPYEHPIIHFINRTITSSFHTLNLGPSKTPDREIGRIYGNILGEARTLFLSKAAYMAETGLQLPPGVMTVEAERRIIHDFPHIKTYMIRDCFFSSVHPINLQCLTSLTVNICLSFIGKVVLLLPSLQSITFRTMFLWEGAEFKCPSLQSMHILASECNDDVFCMNQSVCCSGYSLSPKRSLTIELFWPSDTTIKLVELAPDVEVLVLSFENECVALRVLKSIGRLVEGSMSSTHPSRGHSRLVELRVRLFWVGCDTEIWAVRVAEFMQKCHIGEGPPLVHVSGARDDDHTIVLRRGDR
jgi:hypothetical protein